MIHKYIDDWACLDLVDGEVMAAVFLSDACDDKAFEFLNNVVTDFISEKSKEAGQISWVAFRYYTSLQNALKDLIHIKTSNENFKSVEELIEANSRVIKELSDALYPDYKLVSA